MLCRHGNKGGLGVNLNDTVKLPDLENHLACIFKVSIGRDANSTKILGCKKG